MQKVQVSVAQCKHELARARLNSRLLTQIKRRVYSRRIRGTAAPLEAICEAAVCELNLPLTDVAILLRQPIDRVKRLADCKAWRRRETDEQVRAIQEIAVAEASLNLRTVGFFHQSTVKAADTQRRHWFGRGWKMPDKLILLTEQEAHYLQALAQGLRGADMIRALGQNTTRTRQRSQRGKIITSAMYASDLTYQYRRSLLKKFEAKSTDVILQDFVAV